MNLNQDKPYALWRNLFISIVFGVLIGSLLTNIFTPVIVDGQSMEPTYHSGDILKGSKNVPYSSITYGDVIVFNSNNQRLIKRVIAKENDVVYIKKDCIYVNGMKSEYQLEPIIEENSVSSTPLTIPKNHVFCIGDNINHSKDSRVLGPINYDSIIYKITGTFIVH